MFISLESREVLSKYNFLRGVRRAADLRAIDAGAASRSQC